MVRSAVKANLSVRFLRRRSRRESTGYCTRFSHSAVDRLYHLWADPGPALSDRSPAKNPGGRTARQPRLRAGRARLAFSPALLGHCRGRPDCRTNYGGADVWLAAGADLDPSWLDPDWWC